MTKSELESELKKTKAALTRCQRELKKRNTEIKNAEALAEKLYEETKKTRSLVEKYKTGKSKGGIASAEKRGKFGDILREFWIATSDAIHEDLITAGKMPILSIDDEVDLIAQAVKDADFPFPSIRSKDAIKRHLNSTKRARLAILLTKAASNRK